MIDTECDFSYSWKDITYSDQRLTGGLSEVSGTESVSYVVTTLDQFLVGSHTDSMCGHTDTLSQ